MEDIKTYIESGILELYAMGELSPEEMREVEIMKAQHPEIQAELSEIEKSLESYANINAISPSDGLRDKILGQLPVSGPIGKDVEVDNVVTLPIAQNSNLYKYAFAASVALLLLSWAALYSVYSSLETTKDEVLALQESNQKFSSRASFFDRELKNSKEAMSILNDPSYKRIQLKGTKTAPDASMVVAFNASKKEVLIDLSALKLAANDAEHQYQLWALVDGKPIDLGVFDQSSTDSVGLIKMKNIGVAQAFAVTIEPRGGSASPTMDQMVLMGEL